MEKITDKPLHEACVNSNGQTYDGRKAVRWMFEALTGKPMSEAESEEIVRRAQEIARTRLEAGRG